jgi:hypothetical protein
MITATFLLLSYGITNIAVFGSMFEGWRNFWKRISPAFFGKLFSCPLCLSTWVGFILSFVFSTLGYQTPMFLYGIDYLPLMIFLDGCLTSGGVWLIHTLQEFFERAFYPDSE